MNHPCIVLGLIFGVLLLLSIHGFAQKTDAPNHRFAVRLNTLSVLGLSAIGDLEYTFGKRVGVFAGGGLGIAAVDPVGLGIANGLSTPNCKTSGWSSYGGVRIGLPIGKLVGLSLKGIVSYSHFQEAGSGCNSDIDLPPSPDPYLRNWLGFYACAAYAQTFAKRFFVEPVIGIGPVWTSLNGQPKLNYLSYGPAFQLNLGFRF